jgi:CubicO group peptidase (beta-lactamase class C family)
VTEAPIGGDCDSRFAAVREAFRSNFAHHGERGAAVAVALDGRLVVDLWGGHASEDGRPWRRDTLVNAFSVGKGLVALCPLVLVSRGALDLDAPASRHWPELAAAGKEAITLRHLLSHRAGLPAIREPLPAEALYDWERMTKALAAQEPWWEPGTRHGYHVNTFGFLIGEIVRRASGRSLGTFLREQIAAPLDADVHIGLSDDDERRAADVVWSTETSTRISAEPQSEMSDEQRMIYNTYFNPPGFSGHGIVNTSRWRRAEVPSANCHATARGVARVYAALAAGGTLEGTALVDRDTLAQAVVEHSKGPDNVLGRSCRFGLGYQLPEPDRPLGPNPRSFGHFGAGGALGFADPDANLAFAYVMNKMGPRWQNPTTKNLVEAVYASL